jgi:hypothetical protein
MKVDIDAAGDDLRPWPLAVRFNGSAYWRSMGEHH